MICFLISIILLVLKVTGVIDWPDWVVSLPALCAASCAYWLLMKAEFEYLKSIKNNKEPEQEQ